MKIYDIAREVFAAKVYPGDPEASMEKIYSMSKGDKCNVSKISMGSHSGTHMDAPLHFLEGGKAIDQVELEKCIGICRVVCCDGSVTKEQIRNFLEGGVKRLLIKGKANLLPEAVLELCRQEIFLIGVEGLTVVEGEYQESAHIRLLGMEAAILEGVDLSGVKEGEYFLSAAPLKLGGCDGSPCRPVLVEMD